MTGSNGTGNRSAMRLALCVLALAVTLIAAPAFGATLSDTTAFINWDSLSFTLGPGMSLFFPDQSSTSYALASGSSTWLDDFDTQSGWSNSSATASITDLSGTATGTAFTTTSVLSAAASASSLPVGSHSADAAALRSALFTVSGNGEVTVSIDYSLTQNLTSESEGSADGFSFAGIFLYYDDNSVTVSDKDFILRTITDTASLDKSRTGTLMTSLYFDDGQTGIVDTLISAHSSTSSVVPVSEPPLSLILGFGIAGLGFGRRFLKGRKENAAH